MTSKGKKASTKILNLFPNGRVEVAKGNQWNRPHYRWLNAYSEVTPTGESIPTFRKHWYMMANRDGLKLKFHPTKEAALKALKET